MFTGLARCKGVLRSLTESEGGRRMRIETSMKNTKIGDSVLHSGVCLTLVDPDESGWTVDVAPETLRRSNLADWKPGSIINLEPSLRLGDSLDGHFVFGHIDRVVEVLEIRPESQSRRLWLDMPEEIKPMLAHKGSVALDGISLTVAGVEQNRFEVVLIPHTQKITSLGQCQIGDKLNLEADMLARYAARMITIANK